MPQVVFHCRYIAHSYQGVRLDEENEAELDWPPAPARLHQALIAAALTRLPSELRDAYAGSALDALRWLEQLAPPEIIATKLALLSDRPRPLRVAMPHNSPADSSLASYHPDLAPVLRAFPADGEALRLVYRWRSDEAEFLREAKIYLPALVNLVAQLRYLGRAEDQVECEVCLESSKPGAQQNDQTDIWYPADHGDLRLWTARQNSTNELIENFGRSTPERVQRPLARRFLRLQSYACEAGAGLLPVHAAIFRISRKSRNPDELPVACDAQNAYRWRSPLRALTCDIAKQTKRWDDPQLAQELISGHLASGRPTQRPHLAFVPLPSLSMHGQADGRVRRFALLGYADPADLQKASSIYRVLAASLDGEGIDETGAFERGERRYRLQLFEDPWCDKVWRSFARASQVWLSATPLVIDRAYHVPTYTPDGQHRLSSNERHLIRHAEWTKLLRASLRHIRLPGDLAATCQISLTPSPLLASTERAEHYRAKDDRAPIMHARLEFSCKVRGPLLLGDRRYQGFGLFFPVQ